MESLYYNLSEQEFSRGKKALLWIFATLFFLAGLGTVLLNVIWGDTSVNIGIAAAPFGISVVVGIIAVLASFKKQDHYFTIDNDKIEFKYGLMNPAKRTFLWGDIKEIHFPHKQKKVKLVMNNSSSEVINLIWIEKKKSSHIRKHFFYAAKEMNIKIIKSQVL
jgi:hypothetical protein